MFVILSMLDLLSINQFEKASKQLYEMIPLNVYFMMMYKIMVTKKQLTMTENDRGNDHHHWHVMFAYSQEVQCLSFIRKIINPADIRNKKQVTNKLQQPWIVLELMAKVSANSANPSIPLLFNEGLVKVLFHFINPQSETGMIKSLACTVLANLIYYQITVDPIGWQVLKRQLLMHDGTKRLFSLLTSPSATVNLAKHTTRVESGGLVIRTTANVTGVSTREASRCLCNLFCPSHAIAGSVNNNNICDMMMSDELISIDKPTIWSFRYYHKSGSLKDQSVCWLWLSGDGCLFGRGMDSVGTFFLAGRCEPESGNSYSWLFSKSYINLNTDSLEIWLSETSPESVQSDSNKNRNSHITHTGFFCPSNDATVIPDDTYLYIDEESVDDYLETSRNSGFYGVWERSSQGSHFELDKGGVFRANCISSSKF